MMTGASGALKLAMCEKAPRSDSRKGSFIAIVRLSGKERNFTGEHFWARGCAVSTGFELEQVRTYIREQDAADGAGQS
jgi:hypothetical protein